jgi:hypothetical protein
LKINKSLGMLNSPNSNLKKINFKGTELVVAIRPGAKEFLKALSLKY